MFLYVKDYFQKRVFHILLIIFCGLLTFNSIMTLIDLKNYEMGIDYSRKSEYSKIENIDGKLQITVRRPIVTVGHKYDGMPYKFTWVDGPLFAKNIEVESFTVEYVVYNGYVQDDKIKKYVVDTFTEKYTGRGYQELITKKYDDEYSKFESYIEMNIVDYDLKFNAQVYLPHIFVILASVGFIVPSVVMLFKIRKEEK